MRESDRFIDKKIQLPFKVRDTVLAFGSQSKNTLCFIQGDLAYVGSPLPDLNSPKDYLSFKEEVSFWLRKKPGIIAFDLHPEYQSTKTALNLRAKSYELRAIQHHHAHIASCMAENGLKNERVIGVAFDGTGLGADNRVWGAEFLLCDYRTFQRKAHLREALLAGGERAIREPWRLAAFWLDQAYPGKFLDLNIPFVKSIDKSKWRALKSIMPSEFSPAASSMGRLFDAAAAMVLNRKQAAFEAQLAMELEKISYAAIEKERAYPFRIEKNNGCYIIDPLPLFKEIAADLKAKRPQGDIGLRFHLTVTRMIRDTCLKLSRETKVKRIVLSGGVFQNRLLLKETRGLLAKAGFCVFTQQRLSPGDAGISLGQAAIAGMRS
ncbi:MAG: carbamoyltransferase HypF [Candidatus Omnitrophica bacterium]|nr:carbamoyltransferase HypF [Candidatus Omnitrophota bacterium]